MEHKCTGCGGCCSSLLPVSIKEIRQIQKYIKTNKIKPKRAIGLLDCPFFDISRPKDKCLIYPVRPWICKVFYCDGVVADRKAMRQTRLPVNMQEVFPAEGDVENEQLGTKE